MLHSLEIGDIVDGDKNNRLPLVDVYDHDDLFLGLRDSSSTSSGLTSSSSGGHGGGSLRTLVLMEPYLYGWNRQDSSLLQWRHLPLSWLALLKTFGGVRHLRIDLSRLQQGFPTLIHFIDTLNSSSCSNLIALDLQFDPDHCHRRTVDEDASTDDEEEEEAKVRSSDDTNDVVEADGPKDKYYSSLKDVAPRIWVFCPRLQMLASDCIVYRRGPSLGTTTTAEFRRQAFPRTLSDLR